MKTQKYLQHIKIPNHLRLFKLILIPLIFIGGVIFNVQVKAAASYFGQITKNSLILFQKSNNISQTGVFDSSTRGVMNGE